MVLALRALGWLLFGAGAILFIALGGFGAVRDGNVVAMVAGVLMPVGMFVTALCTVIARWAEMRRRPKKDDQAS